MDSMDRRVKWDQSVLTLCIIFNFYQEKKFTLTLFFFCTGVLKRLKSVQIVWLGGKEGRLDVVF